MPQVSDLTPQYQAAREFRMLEYSTRYGSRFEIDFVGAGSERTPPTIAKIIHGVATYLRLLLNLVSNEQVSV